MRRLGKVRGSVAAVLLTALMTLSLLFTVTATSISQLRFTTHVANAQQAKNLAEAAIATAVSELRKDLSFGQSSGLLPSMPAARVQVGQGAEQGLLSFHSDKARELGIPLSLNNVDADAPAAGWRGRVVPPEAAQLVAVGTCGGVSRTVEAVVYVPRFPYVISSSGRFSSDGPLVLGVLPEQANPVSFDPSELLPGHLVSNRSVEVRGEALISGDVEAVEEISIRDPARVRGLVRPHSAPVPLAKIRISDYQPDPSVSETFHGSEERAVLSGFYQGNGEVVVQGGLDLQGGVLYVDGNLRVHDGGVVGKGAVICTGAISIEGITELESDQQVALLSQGDVTLNGHGAFRGIVYTEGDLRSRGVELFGALITNSDSGGAIELNDSGAVVGEPSLSFDEGWLYEPWQEIVSIPWHPALGPSEMAQVKRRGNVTEQGDEFIIDWTFEWANPDWDGQYGGQGPPPDPESFLAAVGSPPSVREVYDRDGRRTSTNYDEVYAPFWARFQQEYESRLADRLFELEQANVNDHRSEIAGDAFNPPVLAPQRVLGDPVLQTFKLDFNQFLRAEENLRLLLRADH